MALTAAQKSTSNRVNLGGDALEALQALGGILPTDGATNAITIGATTTVILAADATREKVILSNISDERIDVAIGVAAVAGKGIGVPVAGTIVITPSGGCKLAINGICASGGKVMATQTLLVS